MNNIQPHESWRVLTTLWKAIASVKTLSKKEGLFARTGGVAMGLL